MQSKICQKCYELNKDCKCKGGVVKILLYEYEVFALIKRSFQEQHPGKEVKQIKRQEYDKNYVLEVSEKE